MVVTTRFNTREQGLHEITSRISQEVANSKVAEGLCTLFIRHTSASLLIQENGDPSAKRDLEWWLNQLVKENDPGYSHTLEGSDDMPSHIKSALTQTHLSIPILNNELALGTWQGIYIWEHRRRGSAREVVIHIA